MHFYLCSEKIRSGKRCRDAPVNAVLFKFRGSGFADLPAATGIYATAVGETGRFHYCDRIYVRSY